MVALGKCQSWDYRVLLASYTVETNIAEAYHWSISIPFSLTMTRNVYYFEKSVAIFSHGSNQLLQSFERFKEHKRQWSGKMGRIINSSSAHTHTQKGLQIAIPRNGIKINDQKKCNVRGSRDEIMDLHLQLQRIRQKFYMITTHTNTHTTPL